MTSVLMPSFSISWMTGYAPSGRPACSYAEMTALNVCALGLSGARGSARSSARGTANAAGGCGLCMRRSTSCAARGSRARAHAVIAAWYLEERDARARERGPL